MYIAERVDNNAEIHLKTKECWIRSVGICKAQTIGVGHMSNSGGGRVGDAQEAVSSWGSAVSDCRGRRISKSVIADTDVRLAHTGEGSVDGLGVSGHLSQVTVAPQDVGVLRGDGGGGQGCGGGVTDGWGSGVTDGRGAEVPSIGDSDQHGEDHVLKTENEIF
jgi:hypothetical protein